jgi:predicted DNA-binding protein
MQKKLGVAVAPELAEKLKELSERTDIPQARLLRQALELLFEKYQDVLQEPKATKGRK